MTSSSSHRSLVISLEARLRSPLSWCSRSRSLLTSRWAATFCLSSSSLSTLSLATSWREIKSHSVTNVIPHLLQAVPLYLDISVIVPGAGGDPVTAGRPAIPHPIDDGAEIGEKTAAAIVPDPVSPALCLLCSAALSREIDRAGFWHQFRSRDAAKVHFPASAARGAAVQSRALGSARDHFLDALEEGALHLDHFPNALLF